LFSLEPETGLRNTTRRSDGRRPFTQEIADCTLRSHSQVHLDTIHIGGRKFDQLNRLRYSSEGGEWNQQNLTAYASPVSSDPASTFIFMKSLQGFVFIANL